MVNVMEEKDLHVAVYERVGFKFEALTKIVEELARGIRHSAELPLVERDKNDAGVWSSPLTIGYDLT